VTVSGGLAIPAGQSIAMGPVGYQIALLGITKDLTPGMTYHLNLTFDKAGTIIIVVPVTMSALDPSSGGPAVVVGSITVSSQWGRPVSVAAASDATPMAGM
jgi:hypothetical protein